ncbi:MAG: Aminodeoxychorismate lyase [Microgenomates group bacterium GW2011_GWA2_47_8]|nr:MAG: Aminodeoxychorismate lyase [Microgenomates group bacterium GW2011_GWA2_47_8]
MKSNNSFVLRFTLLLLVIGIGIGGGILWWQDAVAPVDTRDPSPRIFVVHRGEGVKSIAARLSQERFIRSSTGFFLLVKFMRIERDLEAGDFRLNSAMDARAIAKELTHGILDVWVTTLEGWRVEEIASKLAKDLNIPETEFLKYAREGYMFPDTYFDEVIVLASIVEREGRTDEDRPVIAGILLKRLKADWPLQTDATLQYALGYQVYEKTWWKKVLTNDDKKIASPYNTYLHPNLPPKPIANPGLASIKAVIYPEDSNYWYYLHDPRGSAHYARTIEEHEQNIASYLR